MAFDTKYSFRAWRRDRSASQNVTDAIKDWSWSGDYRDCCRELSFSCLPSVICDLGGQIRMYDGTKILFSGPIFERERETSAEGQLIDCVAYDHGQYLKRNSTYLAVRKQTPEEVTRSLCRRYGVPCGALAATGIKISRNFLGVNLYQIVQTMYTEASKQTGKKYQVRFAGDSLTVVVKEINGESLRLLPGNNLLRCSSKDSITEMVNSVAVYNDKNVRTATYRSPQGYAALYGLMEKAIRASDEANPKQTARELLRDNGIDTTITAECAGNPKLVAGNTVVLKEPVTGKNGYFWILTDSHSVSKGIYQTKVTLDFRNLMDEEDAGSVPEK